MATLPHFTVITKKLKKVISPKKIHWEKKHFKHIGKNVFWFSFGSILGLFFFASFLYFAYEETHTERIYTGVLVDGVNFSGKSPQAVRNYFHKRNTVLQHTTITLRSEDITATVSARQIGFGYDSALLADQAMTVGRASDSILTNGSLMVQAYLNTVNLPPSYHYSEKKLDALLAPMKKQIDIQPVNPLFNFDNGKVVAFQVGSDGRLLDEDTLKNTILETFKNAALTNGPQQIAMTMPVTIIHATSATDEANSMGIKELVAEGTSLFQGSPSERIFNISLAANRLNGIIIKPGEIFSFDKAVGDISVLSGYKQALVIDNGKTELGDGGGVCQVSTTMFRAALNAGLPIVERHQHAYRVHYYEEDAPGPGIDAAIYSPTVDFKFKNDTGHALLIQTQLDLSEDRLTFALYGTKDDRQVSISTPVITSQTPAPPPLYQDDPTLPAGQIQQTDYSADGADVYFTRTVTKDGKVLDYDKFTSDYQPWQAKYMRGTKT